MITHSVWIGELEKTLFERMCTVQTLRGLILSCERVGYRLKPFVDQLINYLNPQVKGTLFEDLTSTSMNTQHESFQGTECCLERVILEYLQNLLVRMGKTLHIADTTMPAKARQYNKLKHRGAIFSPASFSVRDSRVVIGKRFPGDWYAGKIKQIFTYPFGLPGSQEVYIVVQKFRELSAQEVVRDPYRRYPMVAGRLYHSELEEQIEVVTIQDVIAHFAHTPYDGLEFGFPCFHALPLNKVSFSHYHWSNANFSISNA